MRRLGHSAFDLPAQSRFLQILSILFFLISQRVNSMAGDAIDEFIAQEMTQKNIPGLALSVLDNGQVRKARGYGVRDLETHAAVGPDTVFEIGSITKQFTATLIMMLEAEGKLRLDDRIGRYFTGLPDDWNAITIRHLLTHTSGLPNYTTLDGFEVSRHLTRDQFVRALAPHRLNFQPGAKFSYCNSGYNLLGFITERVARDNYWDLLRTRILNPLKMSSSFSRDLPTKTNRASGYEKQSGRLVPRDSNLTDVFAAGAIVSSIKDLNNWANALETGSIVSKAVLERMWTPVKLNDGSIYQYGFGWRLNDFEGRRNIGHSGSTSGFSASLQRFPETHLTVIVLCNLGQEGVATELARQVALLSESHPAGRQ